MPTAQQQREKLVVLLKQLFQLDQPDLDFGFYRIMHAKAKQVTAFLEKDLIAIAAQTFGQANAEKLAAFQKAYEDAVAQAKSFGAIDPEQTDPVKKAKAALESAKDTSRAEAEVYEHLYRFFERYYDGGDFMARRYLTRETASKAAAYAVPYDGSDVYLHWANNDQYYIKTDEYFANFTFHPTKAPEVEAQKATLFPDAKLPHMPVHFRIVAAAEGEHGDVKSSEATKRYFILHGANPVSIENGELVCRFEFRPDPDKTGQENAWQAKRNEQAVAGILDALANLADLVAKDYLPVLKTPTPTDKQKDRPVLARYVTQYTARNTTDYFIHKDLRGFLRRELDFYIKNEVMRLDDIETADAAQVESYLQQVRCLRQIAGKIIELLTHLEEFQKKLWLKRKFVTQAHWCVSIGTILGIERTADQDAFLAQIVSNNAQRDEWVEWLGIQSVSGDLTKPGFTNPLTVEFLKGHPSLMVDTRLFDRMFAEALLAALPNIDELVDGLMFHADNFQAMLLMHARYRGGVKCVYIDPPYNTDASPIIYKNGYRRSSWASLIADRMRIDRMLRANGTLRCIAIDDFEYADLRGVLDGAGGEVHHATVAVRSKPQGRPTTTGFSANHEYAVFWGDQTANVGRLPRNGGKAERYPYSDEQGIYAWANFRKSGTDSDRGDRRRSYYPVYVKGSSVRVPAMQWKESEEVWEVLESTLPDEVSVWPVDADGREKVWTCSESRARGELADIRVDAGSDGHIELMKKYRPNQEGALPGTWWDSPGYSASESGTKVLKDLFGAKNFDYPKSLYLVKDCLRVLGLAAGEAVLDYFGGSGTTGHAVMELNRELGGHRKFILAEAGLHFDTVLLPRMKKVAFAPEWSDGKPVRTATDEETHRGPRVLKVLRLEAYEDCLNNLQFADDAERAKQLEENAGLREDYMLHYMLDVETRGSASLLNIDQFIDPTVYKLKIKKPGTDEYEWRNVDLLETFNYLLGLRVEHIAAPQTFVAEFEREVDADLPKGQLGRLKIKGKLKQAAEEAGGKWWFRKVEGWLPRNPSTPNDGQREKVLIVWRKLTGDIEQDNMVLDEWFRKHQINPRESYDYDTIYVNGTNNLPNLKLENETWRVRLIEEDFMRLMWDTDEL